MWRQAHHCAPKARSWGPWTEVTAGGSGQLPERAPWELGLGVRAGLRGTQGWEPSGNRVLCSPGISHPGNGLERSHTSHACVPADPA